MKKAAIIFLLVLFSAASSTQAQAWEKFSFTTLDQQVSNVVLTDNTLFAFGQTEYFICPLPVTEDPEWSSMMLPENGVVQNAAVINNGGSSKVFVLMNNNLWMMQAAQWEFIYDDIDNISASQDNDQLFAWSGQLLYSFNGDWTLSAPGAQIEAVASSSLGHTMVVTVDNIYAGESVEALVAWELANQFSINEMVVGGGNYAAFGKIHSDAAWYSAPLETYYGSSHQLTNGQLTSGAIAQDTIWAVGQLGAKGCIFNIADLSSLQVTANPIVQVRSNGQMLVALDNQGNVYVHNNGQRSVTGFINFAQSSKDRIVVAPNPVVSTQLQLISDVTDQVYIVNQLGVDIKKIKVVAGKNTFNLYLSPGMYMLKTHSGIMEKFIVY